MAPRCSGLILPVVTRISMSSSIASHQVVACKFETIWSFVSMSVRHIATILPRIYREPRGHSKRKSSKVKMKGSSADASGVYSRGGAAERGGGRDCAAAKRGGGVPNGSM